MSNLNGFIKLHRKLLAWEWYSDINVRVLFLHCLLRANHKPERFLGTLIGKGQFATSLDHLAKECSLTVRQTRTALSKLKSTGELTSKTTSRFSIITINNWDKWQVNDTQNDKQATSERQANDNKQEYKEYKEIKEKKNIDIFCNVDFEKCFKIYSETCSKLVPLRFEKRSRAILEELNNFLIEIDYDFSYFLNLCQKANELEKIVDSRIDFKMLIKNHIGIMNGKYSAKVNNALERKNAAIQDYLQKMQKEAKRG